MLQTFISAFPWDLTDEGEDEVLDRLHGEIGVTGLSVWAASPPVVQLRPRDVTPRVFRTRGGLCFHPDETRYAATRCKPMVAEWVKAKEPLRRVAEACNARGMPLRLIISASMTGRLAQRHAEMACKNLFAVESHRSLCLSNPDVRTYLECLIRELAETFQPAAIMVSDFEISWPDATGPDFRTGVELGAVQRLLLRTCFCESCLQQAAAADLDAEVVRRSAVVLLDAALNRQADGGSESTAALTDNAPLVAYLKRSAHDLSGLATHLVEVCPCELILDRRLGEHDAVPGANLDWHIPAAVSTRVDRAEQFPAALCPEARRNELRLSSAFRRGPELVSSLTHAVELGFKGVEFGNYGLLPEQAWAPIKQAVRFVRRANSA